MRTLTSRARFLTAGGTPPDLGVGHLPADSDVLGPAVPADGLTVTVSAGSSLFDDRYGLPALKPAKLTPMRAFPDDSPDPAWLHGDLLLQLCAHHPDTIHHAIRDLTRHTRGGMQLRWKMEGYNSPPRPSGTTRNLLGFKDGTANPTGGLASSLVWVDDPVEPAWARGGSYQAVRLIRMLATCRPGTSSSPTSRTSAGNSRPSRNGWPASRSSTTSSRSAAATSSPCLASGTPATGTPGPSFKGSGQVAHVALAGAPCGARAGELDPW
jgi:hypothetical protein